MTMPGNLEKLSPAKNNFFYKIFIPCWLILNLLQAYFTGLGEDEAYYWACSQHLDWGYFDHPPMVELVIKVGWFLFHNELGVRIFGLIISTLSLIGIFQLTDKKNPVLFSAIISSMLLAHVSGFFIAPDIPLIFFCVLFFCLIKKYLEKDSWKTGLALSGIIAGMFYSKYHAILPIVFTLVAYPPFFRRKSFYLITVGSVLLFFPHLFWQIRHHFVTFHFQLYDRSDIGFDILNVFEYIGGQLVIIGPFAAPLLLFAAIRHKTQNSFGRLLKINLAATLLLFLALSFRSHTESNWTAVAFIPLIILSYRFLSDKEYLQKWMYGISFFSMLVFLIIRIHLVYPLVHFSLDMTNQFRGWDKFTAEVEKRKGDAYLVGNDGHLSSQFWFYTQLECYAFNFGLNKNQYDLWDKDKILQGKKVMIVQQGWFDKPYDSLVTPCFEKVYYKTIDTFPLLKYLKISIVKSPTVFRKSSLVSFELNFDCGHDSIIVNNKMALSYHILKDGEISTWDGLRTTFEKEVLKGSFNMNVNVQLPNEPGSYEIEFTTLNESFGWWKNDCRTKISVE